MAASRIAATVRSAAKRSLAPTKAPLVLTPAAVKKVKWLLEEKPEMTALKIGVRTRGCNGLSYTLEYAKEKSKFDEEVVQDGARILIDPKALLSLIGTEMDFVEEKLASEFVFHNPNVKGLCGCGESFNV